MFVNTAAHTGTVTSRSCPITAASRVNAPPPKRQNAPHATDANAPTATPTDCSRPAMRRAFLLDGASGSKCLGMNACPACMSGSPHSTATAKTFPATRCAALTVTPNAFANKMSAVYIDRSANTRNVIGPANAITGASCSFHRSVPHGKWSAGSRLRVVGGATYDAFVGQSKGDAIK
eukprot:31139-Pelagococcus_subviridis.AAC.2